MTRDEIIPGWRAARKLPFKDRRRAVDKIINALGGFGISSSACANAINASPIATSISGDSTKVFVRPWFTAVALQTPLPIREAMLAWWLGATYGVDPRDVLQAIENPSKDGVTDTSTKTGYKFGWPKTFDYLACEEWIVGNVDASTATATDTEKPMAEKYIDAFIDAHDRIIAATDHALRPSNETFSHEVRSYMGRHPSMFLSADQFSTANRLIDARGFDDHIFDRSYSILPEDALLKPVVVSAIKHFATKKDTPMATGTSTATIAPDMTAITRTLEPLLPMVTGGKMGSFAELNALIKSYDELSDSFKERNHKIKSLESELSAARDALTTASAKPMVTGEIVRPDADAPFPTGKLGIAKAKDVFNITGKLASHFNFDVPKFEWDGKHPLVPDVDPDYVFEKRNLALALDALNAGDNTWVYGHTGSGKTTFVEQICARLGWPLMRVNGDSDISRFELIGKTDFKDGETVFTPGALVTALQEGCVLLVDEFDVTRSETAYVLNRMFEMKGLLLLEDGGRFVPPHPMFRAVAACNSRGNGDEYGIYPAVRTQSAATRSRFTVFIEHDYLKPEQETTLITSKTNIAKEMAEKWVRLANEVREAFKKGRILEVVSPREVLAACSRYQRLTARLGNETEALKMSVESAVLARCSSADRAVVAEIVQRVFGIA